MPKNQVTRGHNIVADGWAGAANTHEKLLKCLFSHFLTRADGRTDKPTDQRTKPPIELRVRN